MKKQEVSWINVLNHHLWTVTITESDHDELCSHQFDSEHLPSHVLPTLRFFDDLDILEAIFFRRNPYLLSFLSHQISWSVQWFCDASGRGLGSSFQGTNENKVVIRMRIWSATE